MSKNGSISLTPEQMASTVMPLPTRSERLLADVAKWQKILRLQDWVITATEEEPDRNSNADMRYRANAMRAEIAVDSRIPADHVECKVLHELLEVLTAESRDLMEELIEQVSPEGMKAAYRTRTDDAFHRVIYRLETAFLPRALTQPFNIVKERTQ